MRGSGNHEPGKSVYRLPKVIVVGIDGGSFNVLNQKIAEGLMPNLQKVIKESVSGEMDTYIEGPGQGWASFMTGKSPTRHGIFYWTLSQGANSDLIKDKKIWEILGENGLKSGIINLSYTFPPKPVYGFMISGLGAGLEPGSDVVFSYPDGLIDEIRRNCGGYIWGCQFVEGKKRDYEVLLKKVIKMTEYRILSCYYLLKKYTPDFFMVVFRGADLIQHSFWHYLVPSHRRFYEDGIIKDLINLYFRKLDDFIGKIWECYPSSVKFVISDHGFGEVKTMVYINEYLSRIGMLYKKKNLKSKIGNEYFLKLKKIAKPFYSEFLSKYRFFRDLNKARTKKLNKIDVAIDWQKTIFYTKITDGLYLNNVFSKENVDRLKFDIYERLISLNDPKSGESIFKKVYFKEDLKTERFSDIVPDVIFELNDGYMINPEIFIDNSEVFSSMDDVDIGFWTGSHRRNGVFIAGGDGIIGGRVVNSVKINDIFPTILSIFGIPVPTDVDGRVLKELFDPAGKAL